MKPRYLAPLALVCLLTPVPALAEEPLDWEMVNRIRDEGFNRSQVMATLEHMTDVIGPRLTGSPGARAANEWTRDKLTEWGLENARLEAWGPFGRGWSFSRVSVQMLSPRQVTLMAVPQAWTPGTGRKPARGKAIEIEVEKEEDLAEYAGKLKGKIVFLGDGRAIEPQEGPLSERFSQERLEEITAFDMPDPSALRKFLKRRLEEQQFRKALNEFLEEEKAAATVVISSRDYGILRVGGAGSRQPGESVGVPSVAMTAETYNWILRLLEDGTEVELEIEVAARFHDDDLMAYNTLAEIPGTDKADEIVMVGAHLDSWHAGTGSNDNGAGCAVAMEAVRILKALGVAPRRTIRVGLWTGEEQGLLGSLAHVESLYASRPEPEDPEERKRPSYTWTKRWPITVQPAHEEFSVYFNLDNGSGKIRGIYTQGNAAAGPIFRRWLEPFHDLGADTVTNNDTRGTDHLSFDSYGLPGFQFIQDWLDYFTATHHTNLDVFDHARADDLKQASVIMASFLYHAAVRDERFPREPMPQEPPPAAEEDDDEQDAEDSRRLAPPGVRH
jgi:carboxypeptidase Q